MSQALTVLGAGVTAVKCNRSQSVLSVTVLLQAGETDPKITEIHKQKLYTTFGGCLG